VDGALTVVDLRRDSEQVSELWRGSADSHVSLALAAALAFHEARDHHPVLLSRADYEDALDLTAAALSRALTIYALDRASGVPVSTRFDLRAGRFRCGASVYEQWGGDALTSLVVLRDDVPRALALIKSAGIPFHSHPRPAARARPSAAA
jgi:hypothetical protein